MKKWISLLTKYFNKVRGLFPERLPFSPAEFDAYVARMMATYWLPTQSATDVQFVTAANITHFGPTTARKPMYFFVLAIRAAGAKQVAGFKFQEIKLRQAALDAEAAKSAASVSVKPEATALRAVPSVEQK